MKLVFVSAICLMGSGAGAALAQDAMDPVVAFNNNCRQCHSVKEGDNRLGPNLYQVVGREAGSSEGYSYSSSLASASFAWDDEQLDKWIENPDSVVSGHKMKPYPGIDDEATRSAIIEHLASTGDSGDGESSDEAGESEGGESEDDAT